MDKRFKNKIISALRRLTYSWAPRKEVLERTKVAPATHECELCSKWCYTGSSEKNFQKLKDEHSSKNVVMERFDIDHIEPVLSVETGFTDWNDMIYGMFCPVENLQGICKTCHSEKTKAEVSERKKHRKRK